MTRFTQISTLAMFAVMASTAFVATAEAGPKKVWCQQKTFFLFKTACEERRSFRASKILRARNIPGQPATNFRGRTSQEMSARSPEGDSGDGGRR